MFSQVIFLVTILIIISFAPMANVDDLPFSPLLAFTFAMISYFLLLAIILLQSRLFSKQIPKYRALFFKTANLGFVLFFAMYHFIFVAQRVFPQYSILISLFSLGLYFFGLFVFYLSTSTLKLASLQIKFLAPFIIPYLIFTLLVDVIPENDADIFSAWALNIGSALFLILILIFFPLIIQKIWNCKPLDNLELKEKLEEICQKANYKHGGIKIWTVMNHSMTAGTFGILPKFRYIMLTKKLIDEFTPSQIQAVVAHEIGHSKHKHLIIYPFIFLGIVILTALFSLFFTESIDTFFNLSYLKHPTPFLKMAYPFSIILPFILIFLIYFRFVFGYFSRLFERQADLYIFKLGIDVHDMQSALDHLGTITGGTHTVPCWHHFSLQERIDFLQNAAADKTIIIKHEKKIRVSLIAYTIFIIFSTFLLTADLFPPITPFKQTVSLIDKTSLKISEWVIKETQNAK